MDPVFWNIVESLKNGQRFLTRGCCDGGSLPVVASTPSLDHTGTQSPLTLPSRAPAPPQPTLTEV
ncbi:hypothetical protein OBBRIDRAFT_656882 [Obba rivulosa]|uniref:Uncharacterized protein n=1 Tax=Obba rivulosa TaxID=1052685 RepID=A0A8E2DND9_9APHY|nr:hypothetical protein OBBRIDRAFT_656882 [Obba rivulosa]